MSILKVYFSSLWRDSTTPCQWALCDEQGAMLQSGIAALSAMPKGHDCVAIVAADRVLHIAATLPPGGRRRLNSVLPFVAEEFTLTEPEENHVVPGQILSDGRRMLTIIDKAWLRRIVDAAQAEMLSLRRMIAETLLPATDEGNWALLWDGGGGFVKTGAYSGMALDNGAAGEMPLALRLSLETAPLLPKKIEVRFLHDMSGERKVPQWDDLLIPMVAAEDWDWRRAAIPEDALNLLWGDFTPRAKIQEWWPKLRAGVYLLLAVLVLEMAGSNIEWAILAGERRGLMKDMQKTFRATFGDTVVLVNPVLQMQRNLAELRHVAGLSDSGDFLPLLNLSSKTLTALPAGSVTGLHYEAGRLDVDIKLARVNGFSALKKTLQGSGLAVRMGEIRDLGNAAEARVTLSAEGLQ